MLASTCSIRLPTLATVKFLSRLFTALNLLPSIATTALQVARSRLREGPKEPGLDPTLSESGLSSACDRTGLVLAGVHRLIEYCGNKGWGRIRPGRAHQDDAAVRPGRRREEVAIVLPVKAGEAISR